MIDDNEYEISKVIKLLKKLLEILEKEGQGKVNFATREIRYMIELLSDADSNGNNKKEKIMEVKKVYKSLYPPHGGLTDFFIWRSDFDERKKINGKLDEISDELRNILT